MLVSLFDIRRTGAEVTGVGLSTELSDSVPRRFHAAFSPYRALFFRDQDVADAHRLASAGRFGPLAQTHPMTRTVEGAPQVVPLAARPVRGRRVRTATPPRTTGPRARSSGRPPATSMSRCAGRAPVTP
ncbi:predicted protein [Streptomyces viridosporus ATCC 14672]|uniref:Predicted protein n=1 Tax=Streptomyces viridosporus (strain ATCC 14672 / DSM 40746 / JCM 4963 / KCTC 9882 / NRRL B-12104 / FH 1290) TaxID=566461 RepID=D6AA87_STRV1|nr:predicted protein [Streptomyces viridosporus ATCC 14672]